MKQLQEPVIYLEESDFDSNLRVPAFQGLTILMVQGNYCGYCTQMKPIFQELAERMTGNGLTFATIQVDSEYPSEHIFRNPNFVNAFLRTNLPGVPYIVKMYNGVVVDDSVFKGNRDAKSLHDWIVS